MLDADEAIQAAVDLAASSDVAIIVAGLSAEWESEGFDRPTLDMPGRTDELITRVVEANPKTVVVIQAVSFKSMKLYSASNISNRARQYQCHGHTLHVGSCKLGTPETKLDEAWRMCYTGMSTPLVACLYHSRLGNKTILLI